VITAAGLWTPDDTEKRAGEAVEAFLLRRAAQHPPMQENAPEGRPDPAEAALVSADHAEAAPLGSVAFREIWRRYEDGEITQPVFLVYCAEARKHRGFAHLFGYQRGAPDWTRAPCCVWEAFACGLSPNDLRNIAARGDLRDDVLDDYRQVWRRVVPRFSDTWAEHESTPLRPRATEALALFNNPVRRAPIDRSARAALRARAYAASHGRRLAY
jgi:hypothetical protein